MRQRNLKMKNWSYKIKNQIGLRIALMISIVLGPLLNEAAIAPFIPSALTNPILTPSEVLQIDSKPQAMTKNKSNLKFQYSLIQYDQATQQMDLQETARIALEMKKQVQFDPSEIIPLNMPQQSSDQSFIAKKVARHALENWYDESSFKKSEWGQITTHASDDLEAALLGENNKSFTFKMRAITGRAQLRYQGPVQASLTYEAFENKARLEVLKHVSSETTIVFHSIENKNGNQTEIGLRWNF